MIHKSDWEAAAAAISDEDRQVLGEGPSDAEVLAFSRGELAEPRASEVRTYLATVPELLDALTAPFPAPDAPPLLSEHERASDWMRLRTRLPQDRALRARDGLAVAATIAALCLGGLLVLSRSNVRRLQEPRVNLDSRLLLPDGRRGGLGGERPVQLSAHGNDFLLMPTLINEPPHADYRIDLFDLGATPAPPIYSAAGVRRRSDDTLPMLIPRAFLHPGTFQIVVYGIDAARTDRLATYTVHIPRP